MHDEHGRLNLHDGLLALAQQTGRVLNLLLLVVQAPLVLLIKQARRIVLNRMRTVSITVNMGGTRSQNHLGGPNLVESWLCLMQTVFPRCLRAVSGSPFILNNPLNSSQRYTDIYHRLRRQ